MTEIQQNRYDQVIRRVTNVVGGGSQVNDTLNELFPVVDVERVPGELLLLGGTQLGQGGTIVTGAAATAPHIQLFNPVDSTKLVTVTTVVISVGQTVTVRANVNQIALVTGIGVESSRDGRTPVTTRPVAQIRTRLSGVLTDAQIQWSMLANEPLILTDPNGLAVLPPGSGYEFGNGLVDTDLQVNYWWRERVAEPSELNL